MSRVRLLIRESSDHPSQRADTSCQIRLQLQSSVSAHMNNVATEKKTTRRAVALSVTRRSCHCVIAPLHSPTNSAAILINRVASPNMLPTHLATTLSGSTDIFLQLSAGQVLGSAVSTMHQGTCTPHELRFKFFGEASPLQLGTLSCFFWPSSALIAI